MTHDNTDEPQVKAAHPWAVLEGDTPLFHTPGTFPPEYRADDTLEPIWRAKHGPKPYYEAEGITIYHGDCRDVLPKLTGYNVVVSDVPYGRALRSNRNGPHDDCQIEGDATTELRDWMLDYIATPAIVFGSPFIPRPQGLSPSRILIWDKGEHTGMGDLSWPWKPNYEEIYIIGDGFIGPRSGSVLRHFAVTGTVAIRDGRQHPTEKPISLMRALIVKCPPGAILDPFMGSGSTLRAAKDLGRRAIGIEIDERYCEIAAKRLQQEVMPLFAESE